MIPEELRRGNLIYTIQGIGQVNVVADGLPFKIASIELEGVRAFPHNMNEHEVPEYFKFRYSDISPIPITPEWLERLGFEKEVREWDLVNISYRIEVPNDYGGYIVGNATIDGFKVCLVGCDDGRVGNYIQHVHQLQNLYHILTGQELTVKEKV